ncbi:hypothetical protein JZ751_011779 [Albula glossodonta]|uniref:FERM adjacent domain-containing protein n=1 Tax=Albula glossodonta TaxID=121402 RepID=A0A8T2PQK3_9TELE|nr:hypothetical protein JZ751_011779 [Albula glossodonta]
MPENDSNSLTRKLTKFGSLGSKHRYSGKTAMQMGRDQSVQLPRPDLQVLRTRSKTYPKRVSQPAGTNNVNRSNAKPENGENEGPTKIIAPSPFQNIKTREQSRDTTRKAQCTMGRKRTTEVCLTGWSTPYHFYAQFIIFFLVKMHRTL